MKKMTIKEGVLRALDGEKITILVPHDMSELWIQDFIEAHEAGGFCVFTKDLEKQKAMTEEKQEEAGAYPDNDGGLYTMEGGSVQTVEEEKPKRIRIDTGKIQALAKAGWSIQKIAEEMGVSDTTVRNHLKKEEAS